MGELGEWCRYEREMLRRAWRAYRDRIFKDAAAMVRAVIAFLASIAAGTGVGIALQSLLAAALAAMGAVLFFVLLGIALEPFRAHRELEKALAQLLKRQEPAEKFRATVDDIEASIRAITEPPQSEAFMQALRRYQCQAIARFRKAQKDGLLIPELPLDPHPTSDDPQWDVMIWSKVAVWAQDHWPGEVLKLSQIGTASKITTDQEVVGHMLSHEPETSQEMQRYSIALIRAVMRMGERVAILTGPTRPSTPSTSGASPRSPAPPP